MIEGGAMDPIVTLRPTQLTDLDFVIGLERHAANSPFIGQWTHEEHAAAIDRDDREHWVITCDAHPVGYLIAYKLLTQGHGIYVKRVVVAAKSHGIGRAAVQSFTTHAFRDLGASHVWLT